MGISFNLLKSNEIAFKGNLTRKFFLIKYFQKNVFIFIVLSKKIGKFNSSKLKKTISGLFSNRVFFVINNDFFVEKFVFLIIYF
jgi:hypothetical protein